MRITEILDKRCVRLPMKAQDRDGAIRELVGALHEAGKLDDERAVLEAILARERTRTTGIGRGLAVPHGKSPGSPSLVMAVGKPPKPINFQSTDGKPCDLVVLLASPLDRTGPHIQALAGISRLWLNDEFRQAVGAAESADALYKAITKHQSD